MRCLPGLGGYRQARKLWQAILQDPPHQGHDLQNCRQVELLAEKQKAEYERRDKEKDQDGAEGSGKKHGGQGGHPGKDNQQERPAQGRGKKKEDDDHDEDDESGEQGFQKATEAMCVDGGTRGVEFDDKPEDLYFVSNGWKI